MSNEFVKFDSYIEDIESFRKFLVNASIVEISYLIVSKLENFCFHRGGNV